MNQRTPISKRKLAPQKQSNFWVEGYEVDKVMHFKIHNERLVQIKDKTELEFLNRIKIK